MVTHPIPKGRGFLVQQPPHSSRSRNDLHDFPKREFPLVQRYMCIGFTRLYLPRLWQGYCVPRLCLYRVPCHIAGKSTPLRKGLLFLRSGSRIHGRSGLTDRTSALSGLPSRRVSPCIPVDERTRSTIHPR